MSWSDRGDAWTVTRGATWLAGSRVASQVLGVAITIILARALGATGFGRYAFVGAIVTIANVATTFGTDSLLIREIASGRADAAALSAQAATLQLALSIAFVVLVALGAGSLAGQTGDTIAALRVYSLALLPLAFYGVYSAALRGWERMDLYAVLTVGTAALQAAGAGVAVYFRAGLPHLMVALVIAQCAATALAWWLCRVAHPGFALGAWGGVTTLGRLLRNAWPFAVLTGLAILAQRVGVIMLSWLAGDASAGWFAASARVVEGLKLANYSASGAMLPRASRLAVEQDHAVSELMRGSGLALVAIGAVAAVAATVLAGPIIALLYGPSYAPAVAALRLLCWSLIPAAAAAPVSLALVSRGHERVAMAAGALGLAAAVGLGVRLIPRAGVTGACVAVLVGEVVRLATLLVAHRQKAVS